MPLLNFSIIKLTICLITGIVIGYYHPLNHDLVIYVLSLLLILLVLVGVISNQTLKKTIWFAVISYLLFIFIGVFIVLNYSLKESKNHFLKHINSYQDTLPTITFCINKVLKPNAYNTKYVVDILKVNETKVRGKALLHVKKDSLIHALKVDEVYLSPGKFKAISPPLNPYQFNYKAYLARQYIYMQLFTENQNLFKAGQMYTVFGNAERVRSYIHSKLKKYDFNSDELSIISALLLGQRQNVSKDMHEHYVNAGAVHILAVSGLHIGIILLILSQVFRPLEYLRYGKILKVILLITSLWCFAIIAGLSASVTRAVTMFSIVAIASSLKRPTNVFNTLAISMFFILLFQPLYLFEIGFQLSYLAVFSIVSIDPLLYKLHRSKYWLIDKLWRILTVTIAAQLGILPLSLFYFHKFQGLFFFSNLVIIPILGLILGMGMLVIISSVLNVLPSFVADSYNTIIYRMNEFVAWVSNLDTFFFTDIPFNHFWLIASYITIVALVQLLIKATYHTITFTLLGLLAIQLAYIITDLKRTQNTLIIFHEYRHTLIGDLTHNELKVAHTNKDIKPTQISTISDFAVGNFVKTITKDSLRPLYMFNDKSLLVVDSLCVYNISSFHPDYVLLRASPKLNLNRLIDTLKPGYIIADGSNYKSYVSHWKSICRKRKLPFHNTDEMGAYFIDY